MLIKPIKIIGNEVIKITNCVIYDKDTKKVLLEMKEGFAETDKIYTVSDFENLPTFEMELKNETFF